MPVEDPLLVLAIVAGAAILKHFVWRAASPALARPAWARAADRLGFRQTGEFMIEGVHQGMTVEARAATEIAPGYVYRSATTRWNTVIEVVVPDVPAHFQMAGRDRFDPTFVTGDRDFDAAVSVRGDTLYARSVLGAEARQAVADGVRAGWWLQGGKWVHEASGLHGIEGLLRQGLALGRAVSGGHAGKARRLADEVAGEGAIGARAEALRLLASYARKTPAYATALAAARSDTHGELALAAALIEDSAEDLARVTLACTDLQARTQALVALATRHPSHPRTMQALERLTGRGDTEPVALRQALVSALIAGDPRGREAGLILSAADPEAQVAIPAIEALGEHGTLAAVSALAPLRDRAMGGAASAAALRAILQIQARAPHAEVGGLALVESGGELALAEDDPGAQSEKM